jgi:hypothetical protein
VTSILSAVRLGYQAGLSLLPTRDDGSKAPAVPTWRDYQVTRPSVETMRTFGFEARAGFGMIAGPASGHAECWDFDCRETFAAFVEAAHACGLGAVVDRVRQGYEDETPSGGRRWIVRYPESVTWRDCALARRPGRDGEPKVKVLIELPTFSILAPSNGRTHPSGKAYTRLSGVFATIAECTVEERDSLLELARSFDQMPRRVHEPKTQARQTKAGVLLPGEDYIRRTTWRELLEADGWTHAYDRGETSHWCRPGKTFGAGATTNHGGGDCLHVFSSSTALNADTSYTRFGYYTATRHGDDFEAAAVALYERGYGTRREERQAKYDEQVRRAAQTAPPVFAKPAVETGAGECVLRPLLQQPYSGWFARGAVHLVAGSSGAGKSTLLLDLLRTQMRGGRYLGHSGNQLDYLVLFADRGAVSNRETLERMKIDPQTMPIDHLPPTASGEAALQAILAAIERQPDLPAVVFIEGADLLVEDASKTHVVTPFVVGLRHIAEHYQLAAVLSVGSPKSRPHEQYALKRDQVFGSQAWSRLANTVLVLTVTGDGTTATRDLVVLHRNAAAESFHLVFADGLLVETEASQATEPTMIEWMREAEVFSKQKFREAFSLSGLRATTLLDGYVAIGILREKTKQDRTAYVFNRAGAGKVIPFAPSSAVSVSDCLSDTSPAAEPGAESVRKPTGHGHDQVETTREISNDSEPSSPDLSVFSGPPFLCTSVRPDVLLEPADGQTYTKKGNTRAREDGGVPEWVRADDGPPPEPGSSDAALAGHDQEDTDAAERI